VKPGIFQESRPLDKVSSKEVRTVPKLMKAQLYALSRSRFCLIFLAVTLLISVILFFDNGDVIGSRKELEEMRGQRDLAAFQERWDLREAETEEEMLAILRLRQVAAAPFQAAGGMLFLLFLLPGATLSPALGKSRGIQRELQRCGRIKPLISRMLLSWVFCLLLSTAMYLWFLHRYTDWRAAPIGQLTRNYAVLQLYVLAGVGYSYLVYVLLRKTWLAAPVMLLSEALLHRVIPGVYLFYPFELIPYYNIVSHLDTESLVAPGCPPGTFIGYCAVCAAYIILCPTLAVLIFRRREIR